MATSEDGGRHNGDAPNGPRSFSLGPALGPMPAPWPDGPLGRVDNTFQRVCLEDVGALVPLIQARPAVAREIILALLIEEPHRRPLYPDHLDTLHDNLGIADRHRWYPPLWVRGPFIQLLNANAQEGLEAILRLVNFATARWSSLAQRSGHGPFEVAVPLPEGDRKWQGNYQVYYWYLASPFCPVPVVVALMALEWWLYEQIEKQKDIEGVLGTILDRSQSTALAGLLCAVGCKSPGLFAGPLRPLLVVPEFHLWELQQSVNRQSGTWGIGWHREGPEFFKLAEAWHTLPHRGLTLGRVAQYLFLKLPSMRPFFEEARDRWARRLKELPVDSDFAEHLERLIVTYDIRNWGTETDPQRGKVWAFKEPEALRAKAEPQRRAAEEDIARLVFPVRCRRILDEGHPMPDEEAEGFWAELQRVIQAEQPADEEAAPVHKQDVACAGAAVLLLLNRAWLGRHPDKERWCVEQILAAVRELPLVGSLQNEHDGLDVSADAFCADAAPVIWAERPEDPILRACVARLAATWRYVAVARLFASAARVRERLGDHFRQLQHFLIRWAPVRWQLMLARETGFPPTPPKQCLGLIDRLRTLFYEVGGQLLARSKGGQYRRRKRNRFDPEKWLRRQVEAFARGKISAHVPPWSKYAVARHPAEPYCAEPGDRRGRRSPGLDCDVVRAAYAWLPSLRQAGNLAERAEWVDLWQRILDLTLQMVRLDHEEDEVEDGFPYDYDQWVFRGIAHLLVDLDESENPRQFWEPLVGLGVHVPHYVEWFLVDWFYVNLTPLETPNAFLPRWREMVEFAFASPGWSAGKGTTWHHVDDLWQHLLGFDYHVRGPWRLEHARIIRGMLDLYDRWASTRLAKGYAGGQFMQFLQGPAAEPLRLRALVWIRTASEEVGGYFWHDDGWRTEGARMLNVCWEQDRSAMRADAKAFDAFKVLLKVLAAKQEPLALELLDRVSNS